jgi:hypothetical protein
LANIPGAFVTSLQPGGDGSLTLIYCDRDYPGRLLVQDSQVEVHKLFRLDFKGKVFAYFGSFAPFGLINGRKEVTMTFTAAIFYDIDGSGRFVIKKSMDSFPGPAIEVPAWARVP